MRRSFFLMLGISAATALACAPTVPPAPAPAGAPEGATMTTAELAALHDLHRVAAIDHRDFTHAQLWSAIGPIIDGASKLERDEVGRSVLGRPIYAVRFGHGPTRVLLWSQMHGNESTATMALADIFHFLAASPDHPLAQRLEDRLTVVFVPMLNPDGAEPFERRNAMGIDINRDVREMVTPEARTLKSVQETFQPMFGFNLHDQNVRTRVGRTDRLAAIALLPPAYDDGNPMNDVRSRATHVAAMVRDLVEPFVGGHVTRYDDTFNPRAFGDLMQRWGVSTVLIESGGWRGDPEKQYLRKVNFVALLGVLDAIGSGAYAQADPNRYLELPFNGRSVDDLLIVGGTIVAPGLPSYRADLAIGYRDPLRLEGGRITDVGDLGGFEARDTLDATGLFLHLSPSRAGSGDPLGVHVSPGETPASFDIRRGEDPSSPLVWRVEDGRPLPAEPRG